MQYYIEKRMRKGYRVLSFARNLSSKYKNQLFDTGLDTLKAASKKGVHKAAEATGEFVKKGCS